MGERLVIYGATGYSARLIAVRARELGLEPLLCARDAGKLAPLARHLGLPHRVFSLRDRGALDATVGEARVVLNAAGPFADTARVIVEACLRHRAHYLDITPEAPVIEELARLDAAAAASGVMIMPAVGFDVVPSDCLALYLARHLGSVRRLWVAVTMLAFVTRGSAKTLVRAANGGVVRRDGRLVPVPIGSLEREFEFFEGRRPALNCSLGDNATGYYTTGAREIRTYVDATPAMRAFLLAPRAFGPLLQTAPMQAALAAFTDLLPEDPAALNPETAARHTMTVVVEAESTTGERLTARMRTPEAYSFTGLTAAAIAARVLRGDHEAGFQTPARVYGSEFVLSFPGVVRDGPVDAPARAQTGHA